MMADHEVILDQNEELVLGDTHGLDLGRGGHEHHLDLGQSHDHELGLRHHPLYHHGSGLGQDLEHEANSGDSNGRENESGGIDENTEPIGVAVKFLGNGFVVLHENDDLSVSGNQLAENLGLSLEQNKVMGMGFSAETSKEMGMEHPVEANKEMGTEPPVEENKEPSVQKNEDMGREPSVQEDRDIGMEQCVQENTEMGVELSVEENQQIGMEQSDYFSMDQSFIVDSPVIQARTVPANPTLTVGQEFEDVMSCRRALRDTAIALHFEIQTIKSDKTRFTAKCATEGCPWRIHAAKLPGVPTFTIRTIHESHTCGGISHLGHQQASVQWVANSVEQRLRENPNCKPKEILEEIHRTHGITLSYKQAWRGKERIMASMRGSFEEGYRLLPQYCEQVRRTNPGSIAAVYGSPEDNCFQRLFISFQASIYGFLNGCRPLLGLDRTYLKSKYLGTLLLVTAFDGDGALFPLAFGVVDEENDENWMWFLSELHTLLDMNAEIMPRLTILSDREKGIVEAVEANFPTAFHGFCMLHLTGSFRKEFNNNMLVDFLWEAAQALTVIEFEAKIIEIEQISQDAAYWIRRIPPRLWATAYFEGLRFGHLTANIVESLNTWISEASGLPIVQMMDCIRRQLMLWFNERRETSAQWTSILVPSAERSVAEALERARSYQVLRANDSEFEVISHEGQNTVDIRNRCCLCRGWQINGLPCAHAVAALLSCRQNVHRFTESCFTVANYRKTYLQTIHPIPDKSTWNELSDADPDTAEVVINPPKSLRPPGRPRKKRVRAEDRGRVKRVVHCSRCNQTGHFRTTCATPI